MTRAAWAWLPLLVLTGCAALPPPQVSPVGAVRVAWRAAGSAGPTVVFQSGLGDGMAPWAGVLQRLPPAVSSFAYDRPGYGGSSPPPSAPRTPCDAARELHATLQAAGRPPPYLLVGHSIGGQYQLAFAQLYPAEVAGLLLLDPTHPAHWTMMQQQAPGVAAVVSGLRSVVFSATMRAEFDGQGACLVRSEGAAAAQLDRLPARILVRTRFEPTETADFRAMAQRLAQDWPAWLPGATQRAVDGAGHYIQQDQPDVVVAELLGLWQTLRPDGRQASP